MPVTVLLVDDVEEVRAVVRQALRLYGGFQVVAEAADAAAAVTAAARFHPDVVVLDLGLPDLAGHEVVSRVMAAAPDAKIVIYTGSASFERPELASSVAGLVRKDQDIRYLVELLAGLGRELHRAAEITVGPELSGVAAARRLVADRCREWGATAAVEDARLVVSELVTNALVHTTGTCRLQVRYVGSVLRFEIEDAGGGAPDVQSLRNDSEGGRGLVLVTAICAAWGIDARPDGGKVVWAELVARPDDGTFEPPPRARTIPDPHAAGSPSIQRGPDGGRRSPEGGRAVDRRGIGRPAVALGSGRQLAEP